MLSSQTPSCMAAARFHAPSPPCCTGTTGSERLGLRLDADRWPASLSPVRRGGRGDLANDDVGCSYSSHILAQSGPALLQGMPYGPVGGIIRQHAFCRRVVLIKCGKTLSREMNLGNDWRQFVR